jgi:hypothetical protein
MNRLLKSLVLVLLFSSLCPATTQIRDRLIYDGNDYFISYDEFPLEDYWSDEHPKPECLSMGSTACWRGYIAKWEARNGSLFLKSLVKEAMPNEDETPIPLTDVFPDANGPVPADWFSGVLECNRVEKGKGMLYISIHKGKILGARKATWEQVKNPLDKDFSWRSLLSANKKDGEIRTKRWRLQSTRWIDGDGMLDWEGPAQSGKSFRLRGICFPSGRLWTAGISNHYFLEVPDSIKLPAEVIPVEVTAKKIKKSHYYDYESYQEQSTTKATSAQIVTGSNDRSHLAVSNIKVLPVGTAIQRANDNINMIIEFIIIALLVISILAMLGIGIFGRKEGVSFWSFWFTGSYRYRDMHGYIMTELVKPFLIFNWLSVILFLVLIVYLYFFGYVNVRSIAAIFLSRFS